MWNWFLEILQGCAVTGMAPAVITWTDLCDWQRISGHVLDEWEAMALVQLGGLRASVLTEDKTKAN